METLQGLGFFFIVIGIPVIVGFFIILNYLKYSTKEKLAMIEKGILTSPDTRTITSRKEKMQNILKFGIIFIGISTGILVGYVLDYFTGLSAAVAYSSMIFLFGGISLITFYLLIEKLSNSELEN